MSLTPAQQEAVLARGNILVVAGAGTGKTSTLVERCLNCLTAENPPASLDEILMVTFTEAAAAEMRQRIRARLEEKRAEPAQKLRWEEQLGLFDTAHIGTLHSFCLLLVRQHFYELELDPQLAVMPEEEARLLADETLDTILQKHYSGGNEVAEAVQLLIQTQARGWDLPIRTLVLRLHHYTQTLRDPGGWFESQLQMFESAAPAQWRSWLLSGLSDWRERWQPSLRGLSTTNEKAAECAAIMEKLPSQPSPEEFAETLRQVLKAEMVWPKGKKTILRKPLEEFFAEAKFLGSLLKQDADPLAEDWKWIQKPMLTLLKLAEEFSAKFSDTKRELGMVDFHDLEQHALRLLRDDSGQPTGVARQWREKLRFVFVDEYQDINEAQDAILQALSRQGPAANRFLVGDVKQSIYRFRLADPRIFQKYVESWNGGSHGKSIPLVDNFRSREAILRFVNAIFGSLMRPEIGGVSYDKKNRLSFGDPEGRSALSFSGGNSPCIELHLRLQGTEAFTGEEGDTVAPARIEVMNLEEAGKEARLIARRLKELKASGHQIWDDSTKALRPVDWGDMAVLLRSPSGKAECFAREFTRLGVPLIVARGGFYDSPEVSDLLSLLKLLDNPLQDLPLLAVLHSPLAGLSLDELAEVRLAGTGQLLWSALQRYHEGAENQSGWPKVDRFLNHFAAWRRLARQVSLSRCLETVLQQTHYAEWLLTQPRGEQRRANAERLLALAQQFDQFQRQGLFRFLRFIEAQQAAASEPTVAAISGENSVSLLSIHQSKGLEFPVVVVADLGKAFNLNDLRAEIILDEQYGLCPQIKPPHTGRRYPSLPYWLAKQRQRKESLGEEMRLLYVAMTRARDLLILSGTISEKKLNHHAETTTELTTPALLAARNALDWILAWAAATPGAFPTIPSGRNDWWQWTTCTDTDPRLADDAAGLSPQTDHETASGNLNAEGWKKLRSRLSWQYPHSEATRQPAKTSVTALRRQFVREDEGEATPLFKVQMRRASTGKLTAEEIGTAHHTFLQLLTLERAGSVAELREEAARLQEEKALTGDEVTQLDFKAVAAFWNSELGRKIRASAKDVRRELPFTAHFSPAELTGKPVAAGFSEDDFVVVQGVADLVVLLPEELWVLDFKTDRIDESELPARVKMYEPQLGLYATALGRIYRRPVSAWLHFLASHQSVEVRGESR